MIVRKLVEMKSSNILSRGKGSGQGLGLGLASQARAWRKGTCLFVAPSAARSSSTSTIFVLFSLCRFSVLLGHSPSRTGSSTDKIPLVGRRLTDAANDATCRVYFRS